MGCAAAPPSSTDETEGSTAASEGGDDVGEGDGALAEEAAARMRGGDEHEMPEGECAYGAVVDSHSSDGVLEVQLVYPRFSSHDYRPSLYGADLRMTPEGYAALEAQGGGPHLVRMGADRRWSIEGTDACPQIPDGEI